MSAINTHNKTSSQSVVVHPPTENHVEMALALRAKYRIRKSWMMVRARVFGKDRTSPQGPIWSGYLRLRARNLSAVSSSAKAESEAFLPGSLCEAVFGEHFDAGLE